MCPAGVAARPPFKVQRQTDFGARNRGPNVESRLERVDGSLDLVPVAAASRQ